MIYLHKVFLGFSITHLYTQWRCGEEVHKSQPFPLGPKTQDILFNDHYPVPLPYDIGSAIIATFLDNHFPIEVRFSLIGLVQGHFFNCNVRVEILEICLHYDGIKVTERGMVFDYLFLLPLLG